MSAGDAKKGWLWCYHWLSYGAESRHINAIALLGGGADSVHGCCVGVGSGNVA